jgi:hypothetical protein
VEQSASIDSNVSQKKQRGSRSKKKKQRPQQKPDEYLGSEQDLKDTTNNSDHIDYRA